MLLRLAGGHRALVGLARQALCSLSRQPTLVAPSRSCLVGQMALTPHQHSRFSLTAVTSIGHARSLAPTAPSRLSTLAHLPLSPAALSPPLSLVSSPLSVGLSEPCSGLVQPASPAPFLGMAVQARGMKTQKRRIKRDYRKKTKYKLKTIKAAASRFKLMKSGAIKYWRAGRVHNSQGKTRKQHRQLRRAKILTSGTLYKKLRRAIQQ